MDVLEEPVYGEDATLDLHDAGKSGTSLQQILFQNEVSQSSSPSSSDLSLEGSRSVSSVLEDDKNLTAILAADIINESEGVVDHKHGVEMLDEGRIVEEVSPERGGVAIDVHITENSAGKCDTELFFRENIDLLLRRVEEITKNEEERTREVKVLEARMEDAVERERALTERLSTADVRIIELERENSDRRSAIPELSASVQRANDLVCTILKKLQAVDAEVIMKTSNEEPEDPGYDAETTDLTVGIKALDKMVAATETAFTEYQEKIWKERKELENSVVSLTEEARDIGVLLKVALVEKEAAERTLNKLRGGDQKRVAILQMGLQTMQRVGFGFMMGSPASDGDSHGVLDSGAKADANDSVEEVVSLASTVENMMKKLRVEISVLRKSLDETRADNERLQQLSDSQAHRIAENALYIKDLEERENVLTQNVEELMMEITGAEEDVSRWREACELEVEAGKTVIQECDREVAALKDELERAKASLDQAHKKLKLKDDVAVAAMAAQEAAEKSLRLADARSVILNERIEELMTQLERADRKDRRVWSICWPWEVLRISQGLSHRKPSRRRLSETDSLLWRT